MTEISQEEILDILACRDDVSTARIKIARLINNKTREYRGLGYSDAFYALANLLDIPAQVKSPKEVWETQMLPRLEVLLTPAPQSKLRGEE